MAEKKEPSLAELQKQLSDTQAENESLKTQNTELSFVQKQLSDTQAENESLRKKNAELEETQTGHLKEIELGKQSLADAENLIAEQQAALASGPEVVSDVPVITVDKKKYRVVAPKFNVEGTEYAAKDLNDNKDLAKRLVDSKSSILSLVK